MWPGFLLAVQTATGLMHCRECAVGWNVAGGPDCWCCGAPGSPGELPRGTRAVPFADSHAFGVMGEM